MIFDLCLDTHYLGILLCQFFEHGNPAEFFKATTPIPREVAQHINRIVDLHRVGSNEYQGLVVASCMAFIELGRKFQEIVNEEVTSEQLASFLEQPPDWFSVEPLGSGVLYELTRLPTSIVISGQRLPLEGNDNYHVATARAREHCRLATRDTRLRACYDDLVI